MLEKDDLSPVTVADFAIQALLTATIHAAYPEDKFVGGEESAAGLREHPQHCCSASGSCYSTSCGTLARRPGSGSRPARSRCAR